MANVKLLVTQLKEKLKNVEGIIRKKQEEINSIKKELANKPQSSPPEQKIMFEVTDTRLENIRTDLKDLKENFIKEISESIKGEQEIAKNIASLTKIVSLKDNRNPEFEAIFKQFLSDLKVKDEKLNKNIKELYLSLLDLQRKTVSLRPMEIDYTHFRNINKNLEALKEVSKDEVVVVDQFNSAKIYIGFAKAGSKESDSVWKIKRMVEEKESKTTKTEWADGNTEFDNSWAKRDILKYF